MAEFSDPNNRSGNLGFTLLERILTLLDENDVPFQRMSHPPTYTSEDSAKARGEPLENGAKALVLKVDDDFRLFVMSAVERINSGLIRRYFSARKSRFATSDELMTLTGLVPGSVPPFGRPILDLPLYVDPSILVREKIAFNAAALTESIIMKPEDYCRVAKPDVFAFTGHRSKE